MDEQQYTRGFNHGYLLKQHEPKLYESLLKGITNNSAYKLGLQDGGIQFIGEKNKDKETAKFDDHRNYSIEKGKAIKGLSPDKNSPDIEKD